MPINTLKKIIRIFLSEESIERIKAVRKKYAPTKRIQEVDALYRLLYNAVHDLDESLDLTAKQTVQAFSSQWTELPEGQYMLSDPWFKENVQSILTEQMLLIKPEWFAGKRVLDAGCGNGRWSYGLASMGADITCVDINEIALKETKKAVTPFGVNKQFVHTPMEELHTKIPDQSFDMVYSFGVIHHCNSFNKSFDNVVSRVAEGGILFLYLYGRESLTMDEDLDLFKDRVQYNSIQDEDERVAFLLKRVGGRKEYLHQMHDLLAPLLNRRLEYDYVAERLKAHGFTDIERTMDSSDLFIRAFKGESAKASHDSSLLPKAQPPYWYRHHK